MTEQQALLNKIFNGLAKSGLAPADYMAIIRLISKIVAEPPKKAT